MHRHLSPQNRSFRRFVRLLAMVLMLSPAAFKALAVSCTMQGEMTDDQRSALLQSARKIALAVQDGDSAAVRSMTIASVAARFDPIAASIQRVAPSITQAVITIDAMYLLDASDLKSVQDQTQFFCDAPNNALHEEVTIPQLPPGNYGLAIVHATGVKNPQQLALLLEKEGDWRLAGFFSKPLLFAGHDSLWYWSRARTFQQGGQAWNAHFYYQIASNLASPVQFLSTPNLQKLDREQAAVQAAGLPGLQPVVLNSNGQMFSIASIAPDDSLGGLDLLVHYSTTDTSDPVATRARNLELMKALLMQHPGLRQGFRGLWVFADAPGQPPFGIEQTMSEIP